jgi:hypothetical protein
MKKEHIRTYAISEDGDIAVTRHDKGDHSAISAAYESVPRDRRGLRQGAYLDVFRYADGALAWSGSPNGHDVSAAVTYSLLLGIFAADVNGPDDARRGF